MAGALAGGVMPYKELTPGGGFVRVGGARGVEQQGGVVPSFTRTPGVGFVRVGGRAGAIGAPGGGPGAPWSPPPIPPGFYNPLRDIEAGEGKRGTFQAIEDIGTQRTRGNEDFTSSIEDVGQQRTKAQQAAATALGQIQASFNRLAQRQGEQGNERGTIYGGALLAAAAKRASNQQGSNAGVQRGLDAQLATLKQREEGLTLNHQRSLEDLNTRQQRGEINEAEYEKGIQTLKNTEAAAAGYVAPTGPPKAAAAPTNAYSKVNPRTGEHYREIISGGHTIHLYSNGRKVVVK